jgi:AraC-like DNA-binding protein
MSSQNFGDKQNVLDILKDNLSIADADGDSVAHILAQKVGNKQNVLDVLKDNLTIDEITDTCGYFSSTYFISAFHKYFGVPPGKYRNITPLQ